MSKPRVLFVSYYMLRPVGLIGVLKRCMRLASAMSDAYEISLLNFGPVPPADPLFQRIAHRVEVVSTPENRAGLEALYARVKPAAVVFGEAPCRGMMREAYRAATHCKVQQIGIENCYLRPLNRLTQLRFLHIRRWLLLGLLSRGRNTSKSLGFEVVPPLIQLPAARSTPRNRIVVNGYDPQTLVMAFEILSSIPPGEVVDFFVPDTGVELGSDLPFSSLPHEFRFHRTATDRQLSESITQAKLVLGKAGFQQIVESIMLGSSIVCQMYDSGVYPFMLPLHLKSHVQLVLTREDLARAMPRIRAWITEPAASVWPGSMNHTPDPVSLAAGRLEAMIRS